MKKLLLSLFLLYSCGSDQPDPVTTNCVKFDIFYDVCLQSDGLWYLQKHYGYLDERILKK